MQQIWNWGTIIFAIKQFLNVYLSVKKGLSLTVIAKNRIQIFGCLCHEFRCNKIWMQSNKFKDVLLKSFATLRARDTTNRLIFNHT